MLTVRAVSPLNENCPLTLYHAGLMQHWSPGQRTLARLLAVTGCGGWSRAEWRLLPDTVRSHGISMRDRKGLHRLLNPAAFPLTASPLKNKQLFAQIMEDAGLPIAAACDPSRSDLSAWMDRQTDIIAKPSFRSKGQGVERFQRRGANWQSAKGPITQKALHNRLVGIWRAGGVIQRRLPTHAELVDLSPGALPTLRVVTCLDENGRPEACGLALRLSASGSRPVDNFNAGNLALGIDDMGRCLNAWRSGGKHIPTAHDRHPATHAAITGVPVPDLSCAIAIACRAHLLFADGFTVIGWDIGLTDAGPVLIEGNWNPGTDILQLVTGQGLAQARLGALYHHHLSRLPEERWRAARVVQWDRRG